MLGNMRQPRVDVWQDRRIYPEKSAQVVGSNVINITGLLYRCRVVNGRISGIKYLLARSYHITAGYRSDDIED